MSQPSWEADKMLDVYIHDYFIKRNLPASAKAFQAEGKVSTEPVAIDAPGGFLLEWWSVFWDIFISRTSEKHSEVAASYIETQQLKAREQQNQQLYMQIFRAQQQQQQPRREMAVNGTPNGLGAEVLMRQQSTANALAAKIYEERLKHPQQREAMEEASMKRFNESPNQMLDQAALLKAATSPGQASGQLLQAGNMPTALQQVQARNQQISSVTQDNKSDASTVLNQRSPAADPTMYGMSGVGHSKTTLLSPGASQGANNMQLKGWSLTGLDQMRSSQLLSQSQRSFMQSSPQYHHQLQMLNPQQQQQQQLLLQAQAQAQAQAQGNMSSPGASSLLNEIDVKRGRVLNRNALAVKDGQMNGVGDVSQGFGSPMSGPFSRSQEEMIMKMKLAQMHHHQQQQGNNQMQLAQGQQSQSSQQQPSQQQQQDQQLNMGGGGGVTVDGSISNSFRGNDQSTSKGQHVRKRKQLAASSGPANSTGTGNTTGPSPNSAPSTPSTHTPGDVMSAMGGTLQHGGVSSKPSLMFGSDGAGGLASPSNQLMQAEIDRFVGEDGSLEDNVESFLSINDAEGRESLFSTSKRSPAGHNTDVSKAFTFAEFGCLRASNSKVVSCHFSSDGKLLASAGHDKKAVLWNMDTLKLKSTLEEHSYLITDVRFSPNSTRLATSSFDRTVRVWDADNPSYSLRNFTGHSASILSLDFHPNNEDHLCSCDNDNEIRYWSVNQGVCTRAFKGGMTQVRFQPRLGRLLAAASDNTVSIFDVESSTCIHNLQRHTKTVHSVCWDAKGDLVASVSEDSVRVWALGSGNDGQCVHELSCNGNKFHSCVFHPTYPQLLVIGCYQSLELWNMAENKSMTMPAHDCLIAALAQSPVTGMVASASYDKCVKLWK